MPVPAAVPDTPPLAVLVLAWDEATPAVRAVVEATQASAPVVDSILVMVPQAGAPDHLSAEEFLPLPPLALEPQPVATALETDPEPLILPVAERPLPAVTELTEKEFIKQTVDNKQFSTPATLATPAPRAPLVWAAVRVLRLGSLSLPQLAQLAGQPLPTPTWLGPTTAPATPYLGASEPAREPGAAVKPTHSVFYTVEDELPALLPELPEAPARAAEPQPAAEAGFTKEKVALYDPIAQAPDPEADLPTGQDEEPVYAEVPDSHQVAPDPLAEPATARSAVQASWPEALAALRQPISPPELPELPIAIAMPAARATPPLPPAHPALRPAATHYPAPDLNFQIIQYARFAVPVALAEPPFAVVYAPAWPTWLAAQELRQRTGRPLVLHVSTLAAADDESVETATGWIAELQRQALRRADLILAETPALARRLHHDLGLPAGAVQAVSAADAVAIAQALHGAQLRPAPGLLS